MTVNINGWEFREGKYRKGRIEIFRFDQSAIAKMGGLVVSTCDFVTPGEFVNWMGKVDRFSELIDKGEVICHRA